jgi:hypothetical protein
MTTIPMIALTTRPTDRSAAVSPNRVLETFTEVGDRPVPRGARRRRARLQATRRPRASIRDRMLAELEPMANRLPRRRVPLIVARARAAQPTTRTQPVAGRRTARDGCALVSAAGDAQNNSACGRALGRRPPMGGRAR